MVVMVTLSCGLLNTRCQAVGLKLDGCDGHSGLWTDVTVGLKLDGCDGPLGCGLPNTRCQAVGLKLDGCDGHSGLWTSQYKMSSSEPKVGWL